MSLPKGYVDPEYLRTVGELFAKLKQRTYACMKIQTGHKVLDVGCGPATDTIPLAQLVGSTGEVWGVDYDEAMVAEANHLAERAGVNARIKHKRAEASSLPFESEYFDSYRSERLFQHLLNPAQALSEMTRVTKTNGWIVVLDTDWGTTSIDTDEDDLERKLTRFLAEHAQHDGFSGRKLYRLFKKQGLADVTFEVFPIAVTSYTLARQILTLDRMEQEVLAENIMTQDELRRLLASFEQADEQGVFFISASIVLVAGRKTTGVN